MSDPHPRNQADLRCGTLDEWLLLEPKGTLRLFGLIKRHHRLVAGGWAMTSPIVEIELTEKTARTASGTAYVLLEPMTAWTDDARSAIRSFAAQEGWLRHIVPEPARLRPDEDLGGVPDQIYAGIGKMVRVLGVPWPRRMESEVRLFVRTHGPDYVRVRTRAEEELRRAADAAAGPVS